MSSERELKSAEASPASARHNSVIRLARKERETQFSSEIFRTLELSPGRVSEGIRGAVQWLESLLKHLSENESLQLYLPFAKATHAAAVVATSQPSQILLDRRRAELEADLDAVLKVGLAGISVQPAIDAGPHIVQRSYIYEIRPEGQKVDEQTFKSLGLRVVPSAANEDEDENGYDPLGVYVARGLAHRPDLAALGRLMALPALLDISVLLDIKLLRRDARIDHVLKRTYRPIADALSRQSFTEVAAKEGFEHAFVTHLAWFNASTYQQVTVRVHAPCPLSPVLQDMICQALYGVPTASVAPNGYLDLSCAWPDCNLIWLDRLPQFLSAKRNLFSRAQLQTSSQGSLRLGQLPDGLSVHLSADAREQHVFILGQTGTGKSTHIANLIRQDMNSGEAIVLFDPHGDLANDILCSVPESRRQDLVYVNPVDTSGKFALNPFEPLGGNPASEHNRVVNDLINLFKRIYPEPKEAYGPMFMQYFRNAAFLLLSTLGAEATILQIQRVFADDKFRRELVNKCPREDVRTFWKDIAEDVGCGNDNATIDNVAPYVIAKLTQLSGNEVLQPILGAAKSSLDFRKIVAEKKVCIINLDLPSIGEEDAKILGGLLFMRMVAYLQTQAKLAPNDRIPLRAYLDEVQIYADESLAQSMAQMRKFGMTYTVACQHFAQLDGGGWRPDVGRAILGNAANLILFRLGNFDAHMLAPYVAPMLTAEDLVRLPNFHAAGRLLSTSGEMIDPLVFKSDPPASS